MLWSGLASSSAQVSWLWVYYIYIPIDPRTRSPTSASPAVPEPNDVTSDPSPDSCLFSSAFSAMLFQSHRSKASRGGGLSPQLQRTLESIRSENHESHQNPERNTHHAAAPSTPTLHNAATGPALKYYPTSPQPDPLRTLISVIQRIRHRLCTTLLLLITGNHCCC